jgi:hypothetical protein
MVDSLAMKSIFNSPLLCSKSGVVIQQQHQSPMIPSMEEEEYMSLSNCGNESSKQSKYSTTLELTVCNDKYPCQKQESTEGANATLIADLNKSAIAARIEEELKQIETDFNADDYSQGSDNSKCSFGFEKPKGKARPVQVESHVPVLDVTPSKVNGGSLEDRDNTTCTWSDSEDSSIPAFIYIRRDIPPVVPDDEALGQQYSLHGRKTEDTSPASGLFLKGLRIFTFGGLGRNVKAHLDDDASEAFKQTLVEL